MKRWGGLRAAGVVIAVATILPVVRAEDGGKKPLVAAPLEVFDVARGGEWLFVPVTFNGKTLNFLVDTGSTDTFFDESFRGDLGTSRGKTQIGTAGNDVEVEGFSPPNAFVGSLRLITPPADHPVYTMSLRPLEPFADAKLDGILGLDFLRRYVIEFDPDAEKLSFFAPGDVPPKGQTVVPLTSGASGFATVELVLTGGHTTQCLVDTGNNGSISMPQEFIDGQILDRHIPAADSSASTAGGIRHGRTIRVNEVRLGPLRYGNLICTPSVHSAVGLRFLARHRVIFDFPRNRILLTPGKNFIRPDNYALSGLSIWRVTGEAVVYAVDPGGPADLAGLRAEDVLLKVGDLDPKNVNLNELRRFLSSEEGREVKVAFRRGSEERAVSFTLKPRI